MDSHSVLDNSQIIRYHRLSLWTFLYETLTTSEKKLIVQWIDKEELMFKIFDGHKLAHEWGKKKGRNNMTYPKFLRALRYYYGKDILEKVPGMRSTYQFIRSPKTNNILPHRRRRMIRRQSSSIVEDLFNDLSNGSSEVTQNIVNSCFIQNGNTNYPIFDETEVFPEVSTFQFEYTVCGNDTQNQYNLVPSPPYQAKRLSHEYLNLPCMEYGNFGYTPHFL